MLVSSTVPQQAVSWFLLQSLKAVSPSSGAVCVPSCIIPPSDPVILPENVTAETMDHRLQPTRVQVCGEGALLQQSIHDPYMSGPQNIYNVAKSVFPPLYPVFF